MHASQVLQRTLRLLFPLPAFFEGLLSALSFEFGDCFGGLVGDEADGGVVDVIV